MFSVVGAAIVLGALVWPTTGASAVINDEIKLQGQEFQVAISPVFVEFDLIPGEQTGETFRVRNVGSMETNLRIGIAPLQFSDDTTLLGTPRNEIVDWTTIALEPGCEPVRVDAKTGDIFVHLRVKEECFVKFTAKTPANAPFGEQYMHIFFQEYRDEEDGGIQMIRSLGSNIYGTNRVGVSGGESNDACAKVAEQKIPFWLFEGPLNTTAMVENCGRLNFHAKISIEVRNLFGDLVHEDMEPQDRLVVADSQRTISNAWDNAAIGIYKTTQTVEVLGETYVIEKWTFIIPLWLLVVVLACLLVVVVTIVHDRKKKNIRRKRE